MSNIKDKTFYLTGGVDSLTPHIGIKPGRLIGCLNVWEEGGIIGYKRMKGTEPVDGRPAPSSFGDPAAQVAAMTLITAPPGQGAVLGVCRYKGATYCFRDKVGGASVGMYKTTPAGFVEVVPNQTIHFDAGVTAFVAGETVTGGTSGATAVIDRVVLQGGSWDGTGEGYMVVRGVVGVFVTEALTSASGAANGTTGAVDIVLKTGGEYEFRVHNFYGATNQREMYWVNGVDTAYMFNGAAIVPVLNRGMTVDKPTHLAAHLSRLWLAYPGGSIQRSTVKEPLSFSAILGAGEMTTGAEIVALRVLTKSTLAALCQNDDSIWMLQGVSETDWDFSQFSNVVGAKKNTVQGVNDLVFMSGRKLTSLQSSQRFGDFVSNDMAEGMRTFFEDRTPATSMAVLNKSQYRLFFTDGFVVCVTFNKGKATSSTILEYPFKARCSWSSIEDDEEFIYVGAEDGFVYQLDKGDTLNGEAIKGFLRLPFYHMGALRYNKRFLKMVLELEAPTALSANTKLSLITEFDYGTSEIPDSREYAYTVTGGGTWWDWIDAWGSFAYDQQVIDRASVDLDGIGENMCTYIGFESIYDNQFNMQALTIDYVLLGRVR